VSFDNNQASMMGGVFLLAFFTVDFGLFHFVHSMFLQQLFPFGRDGRGSP